MVELYDDPNRYARRPGVERGPVVRVHGYQEYVADRGWLEPSPADPQLRQKQLLLRPLFHPDVLSGKTVLDLGANGGFFSFLASIQGASAVTAVEMDPDYVAILNEVREALDAATVRIQQLRVQDWGEPADLTLAFAMVHWLYSCTASYGSLDAVLAKLAALTKWMLVVEWIPPEDHAIRSFQHLHWNPRIIRGPYTTEAFEAALQKYFPKIERIGCSTTSRKVYVAWKVPREISIDRRLPLLLPAETVISSRCLTPGSDEPCLSRVYAPDRSATVLKHTTGDLAFREAEILKLLPAPGFPRVLSVNRATDHSWFVMEKIEGRPLLEAFESVRATPQTLACFMAGCLDRLMVLQSLGIQHRDIRADNILLQGLDPIVIDFGWSQRGARGAPAPAGLGDRGRPADGSFCDVYAFGVLLGELAPANSDLFAPLVAAMTAPDPSGRIVESAQLKTILAALELPKAWPVTPRFGIPRREWAPDPPPPSLTDADAKGAEAHNAGSPLDDEALNRQCQALRGVLAIDPEHVPSLTRLARFLLSAGRDAECLDTLNQLCALAPHQIEARRLRGWLQLKSGRLAEAAADFRTLLTRRPREVDALVGLGTCAFHAGDRAAAAECYTRVLQIEPGHQVAMENLALVGLGSSHGPAQAGPGVRSPYPRGSFLPPLDSFAEQVCNVCGSSAGFTLTNPDNPRESWVCGQCGCTSRDRMYIYVLGRALGLHGPLESWAADRAVRILEASGQRAHPALLRQRFDYLNTHYDPQATARPGFDRVRWADLQALHFPNASFDVVMHSEVFEHVRLHQQALAEIFRVLRPGGAMVLTVPFVPRMERNLIRVRPEGDRDIYVLPAEYHADHTLVYRVYGAEFVREMEAAGFEPEVIEWQDPAAGIVPQNAVIARKPVATPTLTKRALDASILIPVFNQLRYTRRCLQAISRHTPAGRYEVIVFDNGSSDGTAEFLREQAERNPAVRVVIHPENLGFVGGNNSAARLARGRCLVLLNNDTEPQPGWLEALLDTAEQHPNAGAVGAKLVYPDGRLQEAGGIVFQDASGWNYGRGQDPADPCYNFVREVDYCSAACLLVRRDLFEQLGGFDERYAPAYYEDTDLCFNLRAAGHRVLFQPRAVVVHHEGATAGTRLDSGYKRQQVTNRQTFREKWSAVLPGQAPPEPAAVLRASDRRPGLRVLVIDPMMPMYDRASGSRRLFEILRLMSAQGHAVTFIARNGQADARYARELEQLGIEVYAGDPDRMRECGYRDSGWRFDLCRLLADRDFDVAWLSFWCIGEQYLSRIRQYSPRTRVILDTVDVHYVRELRQAELANDPVLAAEARRRKSRELAVYRHADLLVTVTEQDRAAIRTELPRALVQIAPNIHSTSTAPPGPEGREGLLFVGNFRHAPNVDAVLFFHREVLPLVRARLPGVRWTIAGNAPPPEVQALAAPEITVTGYVPEIAPLIDSHRVSIAPLRYGAGMKGKIGEALAAGLPVVTTTPGAEGMQREGQEILVVADTPRMFAQAVCRLCEDDDLWRRHAQAGQKHVRDCYSPEIIDRQLRALLVRPRVSVVVLTLNQAAVTRDCLDSLFRAGSSEAPSFELIIVDNGSTDGTVEYLRDLAQQRSEVRVVLNATNRGYATGNNQGMALARGDYLVLLNNDTVVTPGWLERLLEVFDRHPEVGLVGPMTNRASGPQVIQPSPCQHLEELDAFAAQRAVEYAGQSKVTLRLVGFCLALRRPVLHRLGGLDEAYGSGNFEDDDYCLRAAFAGFQARIACDAFVHHVGGQTFQGEGIDYRAAMLRNWQYFRKKWELPEGLAPEQGYPAPTRLPEGLQLRHSLARVGEDHASDLGGRWWEERRRSPDAQATPLAEVAFLGDTATVQRFLEQQQPGEAWAAATHAIQLRPFHPAAWLHLAEIARGQGASALARQCAERAQRLRPGWRRAKRFTKTLPKGGAKTPEWMRLPLALDAAQSQPGESLSVILIARNEADSIGRSLQSVRGVAHQIIVVDTGSTDRTMEIAREHGAEVHTFEWCDDFAAARNAALEHARGDWVLVLDADEELPPDSVDTLRRELRDGRVLAYRLPIVDAGREAEGAHYVPRLFRNVPGAFFRGRIHEHAFGSLQPLWREWGLECRLGKTRLLHHGYAAGADTARAKAERNLRLIQLALEEQPDDVNLRMNLGLELTRTGQAEAGLGEYWGAFQRAERQPAVLSPELREALLTQLCTRLLGDGRAAEVPIVLGSGLARQQPLSASLHYLQGLACMELERWNDAVQALRQCIARRSQPALAPAFAEIHSVAPEQALACCLGRVGQQVEAEQTLRDLVQRYPRSPEPVAVLARFLSEYDRAVEALELLHAALPQFPDDTALWLAGGEIALSRAEFLEFASDWTGEAHKLWPGEHRIVAQRAEALLLLGDTAAALPLWRQALTGEQPDLQAATILCELCQGELGDHALNGRGAAVAREFIRWYQRLARYEVQAPLLAVNSRLPELHGVLPSAAQALESALAEASR